MIKLKFQISGGKLFDLKLLGKQGSLLKQKIELYQYLILHCKIILRGTKSVNVNKMKPQNAEEAMEELKHNFGDERARLRMAQHQIKK